MELQLELASNPEAPGAARDAVDRLAGEVAPAVLDNLRLVLSELVTNSVQFGPGKPISVTVRAESPEQLYGEVRDEGSGTVAIRQSGADGGGLGLMIVDSLTERWGVHDASTQVWFELRA